MLILGKQEMREKRLAEFKAAKSPMELACVIWIDDPEVDVNNTISLSRVPFVEWVEAYKDGRIPDEWQSCKSPQDLADAIWPRFLNSDDTDRFWFNSLRTELIEWINNYCDKTTNDETE